MKKPTYQRINIKHRHTGIFPPPVDLRLHRNPILKHLINKRHLLHHPITNPRSIQALLVREKLRRLRAALLRGCVLRQQLQRRKIQQHKTATTILVKPVNHAEHTIHIIRQFLARELRIGKEGCVTQVVSADPDGVDGFRGRVGEEFGSVLGAEFAVCDEGGEFVAYNVWEGCVDCGEVSRSDLVGAYGTGDGVVEEWFRGVDAGVAWPGEAAGCGG